MAERLTDGGLPPRVPAPWVTPPERGFEVARGRARRRKRRQFGATSTAVLSIALATFLLTRGGGEGLARLGIDRGPVDTAGQVSPDPATPDHGTAARRVPAVVPNPAAARPTTSAIAKPGRPPTARGPVVAAASPGPHPAASATAAPEPPRTVARPPAGAPQYQRDVVDQTYTGCLPLLADWCELAYSPSSVSAGVPVEWQYLMCRPAGVSGADLTFDSDFEFQAVVTNRTGTRELWHFSHDYAWPSRPHNVFVPDGACARWVYTYSAVDDTGRPLAPADYLVTFNSQAHGLETQTYATTFTVTAASPSPTPSAPGSPARQPQQPLGEDVLLHLARPARDARGL